MQFSLVFALLTRLSDGRFHSGERLARDYGVSRSSVFNALCSAADFGVTVHAVRGRGYCLPHPLRWLDIEAVRRAATGAARTLPMHRFDALESTSGWLSTHSAELASGTVCMAEYQTAGRGRRGRAWQGQLGDSLLFSVLWRYESGISALSGASLAAGVALAQAINSTTRHPVGLKWPNDLVVGPRKLGGVLVEVRGDMEGPAVVIVGVGLNLRVHGTLRQQLDQPVCALDELGFASDRNVLLARCLDELAGMLAAYPAQGFAPWCDKWQALDAYRDLPVRLQHANGTEWTGVMAGVDGQGALLLRDADGGLTRHVGGELSLRLAA